jgi:hypothetical protein
MIVEIADIILRYESHSERTQFTVTRLGKQSMILGYTWLRIHNPEINWQTKDVKMSRCPTQCLTCRVETKCEAIAHKATISRINACRAGAFPSMIEELDDQDEATHVNANETEEEVQGECLAFDDDLEFDADHIEIEEGDRVFMAMVHPVDPQHLVRASSTVSKCLAKASTKNSMPKGFNEIVPTALHSYEDVFSETAFNTLPQRQWDHTIELEHEPSPNFRKVYLMTLTEQMEMDAFLDWSHQTVKISARCPSLFHREEGWQAPLCPGLSSTQCHHAKKLIPPPPH